MAIIYPSVDVYKKYYKLTEKEKRFLKKLNEEFSSEYEIYIQPLFFNKPVYCAVLSKNRGVYLILDSQADSEFLKDKELKQMNFYLNSVLEACESKTKEKVLFPIKFSFFQEDENLIIKKMRDYFSSNGSMKDKETEKILKNTYIEMKLILKQRYTDGRETLFDFDKKQKKLILREDTFKVKGAAGTGKTMVLLEKAVRSYKSHKERVLIIVFNITARNLLREKLYKNFSGIDMSKFIILHYHSLERELKHDHKKFKTIFIDEAQDFEKVWYKDIEKYKEENGEIYIFGDEKQNIYNKPLEGKIISTPISGAWNLLTKSYRMKNKIGDLAIEFQKKYYSDKYELDILEKKEEQLLLISNDFSEIHYKYFKSHEKFEKSEAENYIEKIIIDKKLVLGETAVIAAEVKTAVELLGKLWRYVSLESLTFETLEEHKKYEANSKMLEKIRRNRKLQFNPISENLIFSTIHSFKGLERDNIILIISNTSRNAAMDELVYTGITRAVKNLYILNIGQDRYDDFFRMHMTERSLSI